MSNISTHDGSIGSRLKAFRKERRVTQEKLAERAKVSVEIIGKLERGERETALMSTLTALADALGVQLSDLLGRRERLGPGTSAGILAVRDALLSPADLPGAGLAGDQGEPAPVPALERAVRGSWGLYWAGDLSGLAAMLPGLIGEARAARRESGPAAAGPLAQAYQLSADLMVHTGHDDLAMVAAERALAAAAGGNDELQHAILCGTASWVLLHQGRAAEAEAVAVAAAQRVEPDLSRVTPEHRTVWGSLLLYAVAPAATASKAADVDTYLALAREAAAPMAADRHDYWTSFGGTQAAMQATYANAALGRPGKALKAAAGVRRSDLLPISWGAHHLDKAQALATDNSDKGNQAAVAALMTAYQVSAQWFRHQGLARSLTRELVYRKTRAGEPLDTLMAAIGGPGGR